MRVPEPERRSMRAIQAIARRGPGAANVERAIGSRRLFLWTITIAILCSDPRVTLAQAAARDQTNRATVIQQDDTTQQSAGETAVQSPAHTYFTDVVLVNQFGEKMRLFSDLIQGKVVVINSFFGTCQGSCPLTNHNLERVQQALGDHVGKDLRIISISVDPTVDTPASLNEYAKRFNARTGWYFLTGDKQNVDFALRRLGQFVDNKQDHLNIIIIGNERTGLWKKAFGLAHSDELIEVVKSVLNDRSTGDK